MALPGAPVYADVRVKTPLNESGGLAMFRVSAAAEAPTRGVSGIR